MGTTRARAHKQAAKTPAAKKSAKPPKPLATKPARVKLLPGVAKPPESLRGEFPDKNGEKGETTDRAYYRDVWGFDPVADAQELGGGWHRLEAWFPLDHDLPLQAAGVAIGARVDWRGDEVRNRIVFRREETEATVDCVHMIVWEGPAGEILARDNQEMGKMIRDERNGASLAKLPAVEHFAALKSYVAGIAELGILALSSRDGISTALVHQVHRAIKKIAPRVWEGKVLDRVGTIAVEQGPKKLVHLFRVHPKLDKLQNHLFKNPDLIALVREFLPEVPWDQLQLEWQARRAIQHNIKASEGRSWGEEDMWEVPQVEVYPRGPLCLVPFPDQLFSDPHLNSPEVARARLEQFFRRYTLEGKVLAGAYRYDIQKLEDANKKDPAPFWQREVEERKNSALRESALMTASHPLAPPDVVAFLARSPWVDVRAEVAARPDLSPEIQDHLARDASPDVKDALKRAGRRESVPDRGYGTPDIRMARGPATPPDVLTRLAQNKKYEIRAAVAENPSAPAVLLKTLAGDPEHNAKVGLFRNPALPVPVLVILAQDPDPWVRGGVARHQETPAEILEQLARDPEDNVRAEVAGNPNIRPALINQLSQETNPGILTALARNPSCPPEVLAHLSQENNWEIARSLVAHPATPPAVLRGLVSRPDFRLRLELAARTDVKTEILAILARDKQPSVRAIAQARLEHGGSMPPQAPGQITSPGEILWLLVGHPGKVFRFISLGEDDVSPEYARWLRNILEKDPSLERDVGKIYKWEYSYKNIVGDGCVNEYGDEPPGTTYNLPLDGLREIMCGIFPCLLLECDVEPY